VPGRRPRLRTVQGGACICGRRFKPDSELGFAAGGSGTLVKTSDGGRSWKRDRSTDDVAGNLYAIKWTKARPPGLYP